MIYDKKEIEKYLKKLRLLYVEDSQNVRKSTLLTLEEFFDDIIVAVDGVDGYEKFQNLKIDIVITDVNMPRLSGLQMSKKIRYLRKDMPILIFSAYNDPDFLLDAIKIGIDDYLIKPIEIEQFENVLYKSVYTLMLKEQNYKYKKDLEEKIEIQVEKLEQRAKVILEQSKAKNYDTLTKVYNRHKVEELFNILIKDVKNDISNLCVVFIDIDNFKDINNNFNYNIGDKILTTFANLILNNLRKIDIFGRWHGDRFIVLIPGDDLTNAHSNIEALRQIIKKTHFEDIGSLTASFSIAKCKKDETLKSITDKCDKTMYYAKMNGKDRVAKY
ncbi:MAG: diguanylate cyclase [Epsilonproteobacteria bacterium]|nr:diguanylate cyclase [Campylobacterota bacterium]